MADRVTEIVDGAADAVRAAAQGLGVMPSPVPVLIPIRVRDGRSHRAR